MTTTTIKRHPIQKKMLFRADFSRAGREFFALRNAWKKFTQEDVSANKIRQLRNIGQRG